MSSDFMNFTVAYVSQGTPYPDEITELQDPGHYVVAGLRDEDEGAGFSLHVRHADDDVAAEVALIVAAALNRSRFGPGGGEQ